MGLLCLRQLGVVGLQRLPHFIKLSALQLNLDSDGLPRLTRLGRNNLAALGGEPLLHLLLDLLSRLLNLLALLPQGFGLAPDLSILAGKLHLELTRLLNQRRGKRLSQFDFIITVRAVESGLMHCVARSCFQIHRTPYLYCIRMEVRPDSHRATAIRTIPDFTC